MNVVLLILVGCLVLGGVIPDCCANVLNAQDSGPRNLRVDRVIAPEVKAKVKGAGLVWERLNSEVLHLTEKGDYDRALSVAQEGLEVAEQTAGKEHPDVAVALNNLARVHSKKEQYDKAVPYYKRALAIYEQAHGMDHPGLVSTMNNLASLYEQTERKDKALEMQLRALQIEQASQ